MNFTSPVFFLFFPAVLVLHRIVPQRFRWLLLLTASWFFYFYQEPQYLLLLLAATLVTWLSGKFLHNAKTHAMRTAWTAVGIAVPFMLLLFFKYGGMFASLAGALAGNAEGAENTVFNRLLLPVGISFYTFQTVSYVIDIRRGTIEPEPHFGYYALYVSFFPQLVAGPIERPSNLIPQLKAPRALTPHDRKCAIILLLRGFFKKLVLADLLAGFVDPVFGNVSSAVGPSVILALFCFSFQIYCDFSGYSDIAVGTAGLLGIRLMKNFERPYEAHSLREFWRRWHISLTSWFTDYVYIPLGGNRKGKARTVLNTLAVFLLSGLWHGADLSFVLWGGLHGLLLSLENLIGYKGTSRLSKMVGRALTFLLVTLLWIPFRAADLSETGRLFASLFTGWNLQSIQEIVRAAGSSLFRTVTVLSGLVTLYFLDRSAEDAGEGENGPLPEQLLFSGILLLLILVSGFVLMQEGRESAFIYFRF